MESWEDQMEACEEVETVNDNELDKEWRENVNIGARYVEIRQKVLDKVAEFQEMWDGR